MATRASALLRASTGIFAAGLLALATPASAQGLFEFLFGGFHQRTSAEVQSYAEPNDFFRSPDRPRERAESGPASAYCVRMSDGFYFPVQAHAGVSAAQACHAFCPASRARLYSGAGIDHAVASDGSRYADLDTALLYRKQLVAGSTCNGRDRFGLAHVDVNTDPTLRPGDIVATRNGLVAFTGMKNKVADFAPLGSDRAILKSTREKLAGVKIMPTSRDASRATPMVLSEGTRSDDNRRAQLSR
jgi:hypothetical protein